MDNFDIKKFLTENKVTIASQRLAEANDYGVPGGSVVKEKKSGSSAPKAPKAPKAKSAPKEEEEKDEVEEGELPNQQPAGKPKMPPVPGKNNSTSTTTTTSSSSSSKIDAEPGDSPTKMSEENFPKFQEALKILAKMAGKEGGIPEGLAKPLMQIMQTIYMDNKGATPTNEELKGGQKELDKDKDGEIDADDFKMMKKEK